MSKKHDFLRDEQSRDKHPERDQVGSPADADADADHRALAGEGQERGTGKLANDHNKAGHQSPTQINEKRRTPQSRHDRQTLGPGPQNQVSARKGGGGAGRTPRGAG